MFQVAFNNVMWCDSTHNAKHTNCMLRTKTGVGEMAVWIKHFPCQSENQKQDLLNLRKRAGMSMSVACHSNT